MLPPETVYDQVKEFLDANPSGWVKEVDVRAFLSDKVGLLNLCVSLTKLSELEKMESLLSFLEIATAYSVIANEFLQPELEPYILQAVSSPSDRLRSIVASALSHVNKASVPTEFQFSLLTKLLVDEDTGIAVKTSKNIIVWIKRVPQTSELFLSYFQTHRTELNETVNFRYMSLFIEIGEISESLFGDCEFIFAEIVLLFSSNDVLVKLGSLSLIESLSQYKAGQEYLAKSEIASILESELTTDSSDSIEIMLTLANILPFVEKANIILNGKKFLPILKKFIISSNPLERICAMKVLAKLSVDRFAAFLKANWKLFDEVVFAITDFTDIEIVNTAIDTVCQVVKNWDGNLFLETESSQVGLVNQLVASFKRHPFPETQALIYAAFANMIHSGIEESGMRVFFNSPIRQALFQPDSSETRLAKWDLVKVLIREDLSKYLEKGEIQQLEQFAKLGLQYVPRNNELETEAL